MKISLEETLKTRVLHSNLREYLNNNFEAFDAIVWSLCRMNFDTYFNTMRKHLTAAIENKNLSEYITNSWKEQSIHDYSLGKNLYSLFSQLWDQPNSNLEIIEGNLSDRSLAITVLIDNKEVITNFFTNLLHTCADHPDYKPLEISLLFSFLAQLQNATTENEFIKSQAMA